MALDVVTTLGSVPVEFPARVAGRSRLVPVRVEVTVPVNLTPLRQPKAAFTAPSLKNDSRNVTPPLLWFILNVRPEMVPVRPKAAFSAPPLENDSRIPTPLLLWSILNVRPEITPIRGNPVPVVIPRPSRIFDLSLIQIPTVDFNVLRPLRAASYEVSEFRAASAVVFSPDLPYTEPLPTPIAVDMAPLRARYEPPPIRFASVFVDVLTQTPLTLRVDLTPLRARVEQPPVRYAPAILSGLVPAIPPLGTLLLVQAPMRARYEVPPTRFVSALLGGLLATPPVPLDLLVLQTPRRARYEAPQMRGASTSSFGLVGVPPPVDPHTPLTIAIGFFPRTNSAGGHKPIERFRQVLGGPSRPFVWLFPAPPITCQIGIGIVPIYYTAPGPNVVPVETLQPGLLPWGWANWTDVMPVCVQPPGPNVVPVYETNTVWPRVKIRAARPEM